MTDTAIGLAGIGVLVFMLLLRFPIGISLITVASGGIWLLIGPRPALGMLVSVPYEFVGKWTLSSIPMFLLMGYVSYFAGLTKGLFEAARIWLARLPAGLAITSVIGTAGFAAVSGSSVACAAAMARIAIPEMLEKKYDPALATGSLAAAGTLGALIPPSIILILFGIFAEVSISRLFLAGISVGLLSAISYVAVIWAQVMIKPEVAPRKNVQVSREEKIRIMLDIWPTLLLISCVLGGLFSGFFSATEAGGVGALIAILIGFLRGSLTFPLLQKSIKETLVTTAGLFIIAMGANLLSRFLSLSGADLLIGDIITAFASTDLTLIITIALIYIVLGMFLDPIGAMLLTLPIFLPTISERGIDIIWFGIFVTKLLEVGMITPPIGLNVFVIKGVVGDAVPLGTIFKGIIIFLIADLFVLIAIVFFPGVVTFLPSILM